MATTERRINKLIRNIPEYFLNGADFKIEKEAPGSVVDRIDVLYTPKPEFYFKFKRNGPYNNIDYWPSEYNQPFHTVNHKISSESEAEADAEYKFKDWLQNLKIELDAIQENKFIQNPYFLELTEEDLDKPFNSFRKKLYLDAVENIITKILLAPTIRYHQKKVLMGVFERSKKELETVQISFSHPVGTKVNYLTPRTWLKKLNKNLKKAGFWAVAIVGGAILTKATEKMLFPDEQKQVIYIIQQNFHFNPSDPLIYSSEYYKHFDPDSLRMKIQFQKYNTLKPDIKEIQPKKTNLLEENNKPPTNLNQALQPEPEFRIRKRKEPGSKPE